MRTTENLSLRLDPEVVRLARRTAEERRQTLREFFEEALRRHVAAVTRPEEASNLLSTVEAAFMNRLDKRLQDVLERVAALSAKEATDQAHALQMIKRLLYAQVGDQKKTYTVVDQAWKEAVERVRSRGRPLPPEAVKELEEKLAAAEKLAADRGEQLVQARNEAERAGKEVTRLRQASSTPDETVTRLQDRVRELERILDRETWVISALQSQCDSVPGRKTAAELRYEHFRRHMEVAD